MIQRWRAIFPNDGGYMTEDKCGKWVYYADHEAIVKELVEALEGAVPVINNLARNIELIPGAQVFSRRDYQQMMGNIREAIAKAKEVS
jgi:hypothetical protein